MFDYYRCENFFHFKTKKLHSLRHLALVKIYYSSTSQSLQLFFTANNSIVFLKIHLSHASLYSALLEHLFHQLARQSAYT